ncbi:MAG: glutamate 5-kinase [Acidimicrobiia bacterium]
MRSAVPPGAPVVLKVGSSSLVSGTGQADPEAIRLVASHVGALWERGHPSVLVTSGAVAAGLPLLGMETRPRELPDLQVAAAVGQGRLINLYADAFAVQERPVGQVLITRDVLSRREQYLHAREALARMLRLGVVPVVNENDTVVVDELKFGDNDRLAAIVSHLVRAGMLILLSDTPGLFSHDPTLSSSAQLLRAVQHTDEALDVLLRHARGGSLGSGGPATKVAAAQMAAWSGIPTVIAAASEPDVAVRAVSGDEVGTWVAPRESRLPARKLWIAFGLPSEGRIEVDEGAVEALTQRGRSLLAVGVTGVGGDFPAGAAVEVTGRGETVAKGLVALSSEEIREHRGRHSSRVGGEVIHRDDLVVLA